MSYVAPTPKFAMWALDGLQVLSCKNFLDHRAASSSIGQVNKTQRGGEESLNASRITSRWFLQVVAVRITYHLFLWNMVEPLKPRGAPGGYPPTPLGRRPGSLYVGCQVPSPSSVSGCWEAARPTPRPLRRMNAPGRRACGTTKGAAPALLTEHGVCVGCGSARRLADVCRFMH